jgi:hypothetical protein
VAGHSRDLDARLLQRQSRGGGAGEAAAGGADADRVTANAVEHFLEHERRVSINRRVLGIGGDEAVDPIARAAAAAKRVSNMKRGGPRGIGAEVTTAAGDVASGGKSAFRAALGFAGDLVLVVDAILSIRDIAKGIDKGADRSISLQQKQLEQQGAMLDLWKFMSRPFYYMAYAWSTKADQNRQAAGQPSLEATPPMMTTRFPSAAGSMQPNMTYSAGGGVWHHSNQGQGSVIHIHAGNTIHVPSLISAVTHEVNRQGAMAVGG